MKGSTSEMMEPLRSITVFMGNDVELVFPEHASGKKCRKFGKLKCRFGEPMCLSRSMMKVVRFVERAGPDRLELVRIVISDLSMIREINLLVSVLAFYVQDRITFYVPYDLLCGSVFHIRLREFGFKVFVICPWASEDPVCFIRSYMESAYTKHNPYRYCFIVGSEEEISACREVALQQDLPDCEIAMLPCAEDRAGLLSSAVLRPGCLTIFPDGTIYSDVDDTPSGSVLDPEESWSAIFRRSRENLS